MSKNRKFKLPPHLVALITDCDPRHPPFLTDEYYLNDDPGAHGYLRIDLQAGTWTYQYWSYEPRRHPIGEGGAYSGGVLGVFERSNLIHLQAMLALAYRGKSQSEPSSDDD
jgi:hypothetical protein